MMDGYKVAPADRTKVGKITTESAARYELYYQAMLEKFTAPRFRVVRNTAHQGFALTVKAGLELCTTTYALIAQYDRMFCAPFAKLELLLQTIEENPHMRYMGFPTSTNINHDKIISTNYNLYCLNKPGVKIHLGEHLYLQPLAFWFDSQHICHIQRYLQIYRPYKNLPPHLRELVGIRSIKDMLLRPGDFIEDRFGQMQRRILWSLAVQGKVDLKAMSGQSDPGNEHSVDSDCSETEKQVQEGVVDSSESDSAATARTDNSREAYADLVVEMFRWYGSYLCWHNTSPTPYDVHLAHDHSDTLVMVRHLRGRQLNSDGVAWKLGTFSEGSVSGGYWKSRENTPVSRTDGDRGPQDAENSSSEAVMEGVSDESDLTQTVSALGVDGGDIVEYRTVVH